MLPRRTMGVRKQHILNKAGAFFSTFHAYLHDYRNYRSRKRQAHMYS